VAELVRGTFTILLDEWPQSPDQVEALADDQVRVPGAFLIGWSLGPGEQVPSSVDPLRAPAAPKRGFRLDVEWVRRI
jgi:hypothetical protein